MLAGVVVVMDAASVQLTPRELGAALAKCFQGWHVSNLGAAGRTLMAWVPRASATGETITSLISQNAAAVKVSDDDEARQMSGPGDNYRPLSVRIRGGTEYCATTECDLYGYVYPTPEYLAAKAAVVKSVELVAEDSQYGYYKPVRGSVGFGGAVDLSVVWNDSNLIEIYKTAIAMAKSRLAAADPAWRDPRSRLAADAQFADCIRKLVFAHPV